MQRPLCCAGHRQTPLQYPRRWIHYLLDWNIVFITFGFAHPNPKCCCCRFWRKAHSRCPEDECVVRWEAFGDCPWDRIASRHLFWTLLIFFLFFRDRQLQPSRCVRNLQPDSELCSHCDVHPLFTTRRYCSGCSDRVSNRTFLRDCCVMFLPCTNLFLFVSSSRGYLGACSVCALSVEQPSHSRSSLCSAGLVEESLHPQDLHLSRSTRLPSGHAGGLQRSVTQDTLCCTSLNWTQSLLLCYDLSSSLGDTLAQASDLVPLLLQTVEKAAAQNSQYALLAEGVAASVLLSRLTLLEIQTGNTGISTLTSSYLVKELLAYKDVNYFFVSAEAKFSNFWNLILDEKKPLFTTEKFLSQANDESKATCLTILKAHECFYILRREMKSLSLCLQLCSQCCCSVRGSSWIMLTGLTPANHSKPVHLCLIYWN